MLTPQKIHYEIGGRGEATPFGGLFAMHRLVTRLGLVTEIDQRLRLLKMHLPYHESDHVLTLAYSVLTGGTRLEDIDRLRNDVPLMNGLGARLLPDPTTTGDFLRRFAEADLVALMDAVNSVRPRLWPAGVRICSERSPSSTRTARAWRPRVNSSRAWTSPTRASGATHRC